MALQPVAGPQLIQFEELSALIVEDNLAMRGTLKSMLNGFELNKLEFAQRAAEARKKIAARQFDLILCDYMLDMDGMNGQELLEELRLTKLLSLDTIFVMITAERMYEKVVATAEYGPDDYIIKPFSPDVLKLRLSRAIERKQALAEVNRCIDKRDVMAALQACEAGLKQAPRFAVDFLRLKAELLLQQERHEEAQTIYQDILKHKAVPWARYGMAQILRATGQLEEAEAELAALVADNPLFLRAYDSLAKVQRSRGDGTAAQATLQKAADKSVSIARISEIGDLARQNGDLLTAEIMLAKTVSRAGVSDIVNADHVLALAAVKTELGKPDEALQVLAGAKRSMPGGGMSLTAAVVESRIYAEKGNLEHARSMLDKALGILNRDELTISQELAPELISACLLTNHPDTFALAQRILEQHSDEALREQLQRLFTRHGHPTAFANASEEALKAVTRINNEGVQAASRRDFATAVKLMSDAYMRMPGNSRIGINLCKILLAALEMEGFSTQYAHQAEDIVARLMSMQEQSTREQAQAIKQKLLGILQKQGALWRN